VFGANDGLVSNLALVLGIGATGVSNQTVLFTGIAGLMAGALSMAAGEYVSVRSQRELLLSTHPDPDAQSALPHLDLDANELALVYRARGMDSADAESQARTVLQTYHLEADTPEATGVDPAGSRSRVPSSSRPGRCLASSRPDSSRPRKSGGVDDLYLHDQLLSISFRSQGSLRSRSIQASRSLSYEVAVGVGIKQAGRRWPASVRWPG
jgi:hypothetical protein